jgi:protein-tyrosine phosphatase
MSFPSNMQDLIQCSSGFELKKCELRNFNLKLTHTTKKKLLSYAWVTTKYYLGLYDKYCSVDWSNVSRLIFVCKGNICRSPYAEVMAKKLGIDAVSIGLHTKEGSFADKGALKCASYRGIELEDHRVRVFESIEVFKTDLMVGMEPWHIERFNKVNSNACQVTLLGLWCTKKKILLSDPYAKPDVFFEDCFVSIDNALTNMNKHYSSQE